MFIQFLPAALGAVGKLFGAASGRAESDRGNENDYISRENNRRTVQHGQEQRSLIDLLGMQENATMDRAQMGVTAPQARSKQAVLGSLMQNLQPAQISGLPSGVSMPQMSGGLTPAALSSQARAGGGELQRQALMALLSKSDVPAATNYPETGKIQSPEMLGYKDPGKMESILSAIGLIGSTGGALGELLKKKQAPPVDVNTP